MIATQLAYWIKSAFHTYTVCPKQPMLDYWTLHILHQQLCSVSFDVMWWCLRPMNITTFSQFNFYPSFIEFIFSTDFCRLHFVHCIPHGYRVYRVYRVSYNVTKSFNITCFLTNLTFIGVFSQRYTELNRNIHTYTNTKWCPLQPTNDFVTWVHFFSSSFSALWVRCVCSYLNVLWKHNNFHSYLMGFGILLFADWIIFVLIIICDWIESEWFVLFSICGLMSAFAYVLFDFLSV